MQRKLVQMGEHTLMSTIPSKWIKKHGLRKGDHIEFREVENKLVLSSTAEIYERKTTIHVSSPTIELIWRIIQPCYTSGYDEVKITFSDKKALPHIQRSSAWLIGFEIVETKEDYVILKSISKQLDQEFGTILRRVFLILKEMAKTFQEILNKKDLSRLEEIKSLEFTMSKYTMFLKRIINRTGYKYPHYMYAIVSYLELAANHIEYLKRYYTRNPKKRIEKVSVKDFSLIVELIDKTYDLYYNFEGDTFLWIAEAQPHFKWFGSIKDFQVRHNFTAMAEYIVQIARQIQALNIKPIKEY